MNEYKIGDIANGHILTENGWIPAPPTPAAPVPPKKKRTGLKIAGGVFGVLLLIGILSGGGDDIETAASPTPEDTASAPAEVEETEEEVVEVVEESAPGIGDKVRDGKFEFVVTKVERGLSTYGEGFFTEEAQGKFTVVKVTVENIGDEAQTFFASNATGIDSKGRSLDAESILDDSMLEDINPGNSIKATVVFDVAKGETLDAVVLHDSMFSGGVTVALS